MNVSIGGEECVAGAFGWMNSDKTWDVVVFVSLKEKLKETLKLGPDVIAGITNNEVFSNQSSKALPLPIVFKDKQRCADTGMAPIEYCNWYGDNQAEIEGLLEEWRLSGQVPGKLKKIPLIVEYRVAKVSFP